MRDSYRLIDGDSWEIWVGVEDGEFEVEVQVVDMQIASVGAWQRTNRKRRGGSLTTADVICYLIDKASHPEPEPESWSSSSIKPQVNDE